MTTAGQTSSAFRLLVLGGTSWLGGAVAREALARGQAVTCLARGAAGSPPDGVRWVRADRREPGAYDEVGAADWDAVVDVSWQPDQVRSALAALAPRARHWVYVSSCSVYADDSVPDTDESAATHPPHPDPGPVDVEAYGPAKVACENACLETLGADRTFLARAGLIAGYGDRSDRFGYWPARMAQAGDRPTVLGPAGDVLTQVIDVDDLAGWLVDAAVHRTAGAFNAVGDPVPVRQVLEDSARAAGTAPRVREVDDAWLTAHGVAPWSGPESLPLWLPQPEYAGFATRSGAAARAAGLRSRPVADTAAAALRWEREQGLDRDRRAGLTAARESELLEALGD